jgi:hypothetical protein
LRAEFCKGGREETVQLWDIHPTVMMTEGEESTLLRAVTKQRLVKKLQAGEDLAFSDL